MKLVLLIALAATLAAAESHPSWWAYASSEATALDGMHWTDPQRPPLAADLDCLREGREMAAGCEYFPLLTRGVLPDDPLAGLSEPLDADEPETAPSPRPVAVPKIAPAPQLADDAEQPTFKFEITHVEASGPQIIRILNLDEGIREIVLPPGR